MEKISISDLLYFPSCHRSWLWGKTYGPKEPDDFLWIGTGVHNGLEGYYKNNRNRSLAMVNFAKWRSDSLNRVKRSLGGIWTTSGSKFIEAGKLCEGMLLNFFDYDQTVQPPALQGEIAGCELFLSHPLIPNEVTLRGKLDLVLKDFRGRIHIVDHKTFSTPPSYLALDIDEQLTGYCYLYWKTFGVIPASVSYDIIFKGVPEPPPELKNGSLSKSKSLYTSYNLYIEEIRKRGFSEGDYVDVLDHYRQAGWDQFFLEMTSTRNQNELEAFELRSQIKAREILRAKQDPDVYAYPSPSIYNCRYCHFKLPCKAQDEGGDANFILETNFSKEYLY